MIQWHWRKWLCNKLGHKWRYSTICDNKAERECSRCHLRVNIKCVDHPPISDWWKARRKSSKPSE